MKCATIQRSELKAIPSITAPTTPRKRELIAQWIAVDGKLTCKWNSTRS